MNREHKRRMKREQKSKDKLAAQMRANPGAPRRERTKPKQFIREIMAELRRVNWPTRQEVATYSFVVLVVVLLMVGLVFLFDLGFAKGVFALFKPTTPK